MVTLFEVKGNWKVALKIEKFIKNQKPLLKPWFGKKIFLPH